MSVRTAEMIRVCRRALAKHGLLMNFSKGNTECILRPVGDGSQNLMACVPRVVDQKGHHCRRCRRQGGEIVQALGHDPHSDGQHDGGGQSESQSDGGCIAGQVLWLSEIVTPDQVAAGGHAVVVHSFLCRGGPGARARQRC